MRRSVIVATVVLTGACAAGPASTSSHPLQSTSTVVPSRPAAPVTTTPVTSSDLEVSADQSPDVFEGESGKGWRLVRVEGPEGLSFSRDHFRDWNYGQQLSGLDSPGIATTEWSLGRMWEMIDGPRPVVDFDNEVLISLPIAVPGLCTDARFEGLVIRPSMVFGLIAHEPAFATLDYHDGQPTRLCTTETWQVTFYVVVARELLPDSAFTLHAENPHGCADCHGPSVFIPDLDNTTELDLDLFGPTRVRIFLAGTTPPFGRLYMVVDVERQAGYLISRGSWSDFRSPEEFRATGRSTSFEAFVTECEGEDAPNESRESCLECDGDACDVYEPIGDVCKFTYEPVPLRDTIVTLVFDGTNCTLEVELTEG